MKFISITKTTIHVQVPPSVMQTYLPNRWDELPNQRGSEFKLKNGMDAIFHGDNTYHLRYVASSPKELPKAFALTKSMVASLNERYQKYRHSKPQVPVARPSSSVAPVCCFRDISPENSFDLPPWA